MSLISLKTREVRVKSWFAAVMLCEKRIHFRPEGNSQLLDILSSPCSKECFFFFFTTPGMKRNYGVCLWRLEIILMMGGVKI